MNWVERFGVHFSGNYRVCRTTQGFFDVWFYSQTKSGIVQRNFKTRADAMAFAEKHQAREEALLQSLDAVAVK